MRPEKRIAVAGRLLRKVPTMASLTRSKNGSYLLQFAIDANERRSFRLGKIAEAAALQIKHHVELIA